MKLNQVYGITGVMGSGKSTVAKMLKNKGCILFDADFYAKNVLSKNYEKYTIIKKEIIDQFQELSVQKFQQKIFNKELNRAILGQLVFSDDKLLEVLNQIIHPHVHYLLLKDLSQIKKSNMKNKLVFYDVPLLFETHLHKETKENIVVYAPEKICIERAILRTNLSESDIKKRLSKQISIEKKKNLADYVIDNSKDLSYLEKDVDDLYLKLSY